MNNCGSNRAGPNWSPHLPLLSHWCCRLALLCFSHRFRHPPRLVEATEKKHERPPSTSLYCLLVFSGFLGKVLRDAAIGPLKSRARSPPKGCILFLSSDVFLQRTSRCCNRPTPKNRDYSPYPYSFLLFSLPSVLVPQKCL